MSVQSLLELEDLSQVAEREKPKPKPRPRSRIPQPEWGSPSKSKREQDVDDVISISSGGGGSVAGDKRQLLYSKPESATVSAFDNPAFLTDEEDKVKLVSTNLEDNPRKPEPLRRKRRPNESRRLSSGSSQVESDNSNILGRGRIAAEDANGNDKERVDYDSTSTYTVENEKYNQRRLDKKPPKPKPRPKQSLFASDEERKTRTGTPSDSESNDDNGDETRREKVGGGGGSAPPKKRTGHLTVQIDPNATNENDGNNDKSASNQPEAADTVSISSSVNIPKETTVKQSRFSKLFASSSSDDKKKVAMSTEGSKEKPSLVNRWRKTFMKASSKSIEESEATEEAQDEEKAEPQATSPNEKTSKKGKAKETRIFMPESSSNDEEEDEISSKSGVTVASGIKAEETRNIDADVEKGKPEKTEEIPPEKHTRFGPMAKLLRSRSKDKEVDPNKRDKSVESKGKDEKREKVDLSKSDQREKGSKPVETVVKGESKEKVGQMKKWKNALEKVQSDKVKEKRKKQSRTLHPSSSEEEISESNDSDKEKSKSPAPRPKRKHTSKPREPLQVTDSGGKDLLFGVTIHSSDLLPLDPNVIHPVVKVSLMLQGGLYVKRGGGSSEVVSSKSDRKSREGNRRRSKGSSSEQLSTTNVSESVLPIMSQPCQARHSIPTFAPTWNELVVFEEPFRRFTLEGNHGDSEYEPIVFFEIMDFLPMTSNGTVGTTSTSGYHGSETGWYKLAWAFLKPIGTNGHVNLGKKLRLQLFKPVRLRRKDKLPGPEPFSWWKSGKREKINATLYVTPKGITPPETTTASLRQLLSMRKEHLTQAILDSQLATKSRTSKRSKKASSFELRELANWSKMEGQSCRPPNKLVASLPSSQIESLNIVISGNVHSLKFSPCGTKLAAGLDTEELHVILLFQIRSWTLQKTLKGHHGIIYEIAWKIFEFDEQTSFHYLASASADATVRIWKMENSDEKSLALFKVLHHPSYVYCVRFHPTHPSLIATGCFDSIIRLWDMMPKNEDHQGQGARRNKRSRNTEKYFDETSPVILLDKHNSFVNCLLFDPDGTTLFSGDGSAGLFKWTCKSPGLKKSWKLEKDVKLHPSAIPVNSLDLHPTGNRILVHLRDSSIRILDVVSFISLQTFPGIKNESLQISSCFSPCGNLVLSGSEDSTLCIWDADTAKILQFLSPPNHPSCVVTSVDYHPFDYFVAVGLSSTISEPSPVLLYFYEPAKLASYPLLKRTAKKMRESLEKSRSQSTESFEDGNGNLSGRSRSFSSTKRGSSSEKFLSIIQKLDTALYFAQQRNKMRQTETQKSICASSSQSQELVEDNLDEEDAQVKAENMNLAVEEDSTDMKTHHFIKKSRPKSASTATKEKRHKYRQGTQRANLSDSEQMYKLKLESVSVEYEHPAPESTVFQESQMLADEPEKERYEGKKAVVADDGDVDFEDFKVARPRPLNRRTTTNGLLDKPNDITKTKTRNNSLD